MYTLLSTESVAVTKIHRIITQRRNSPFILRNNGRAYQTLIYTKERRTDTRTAVLDIVYTWTGAQTKQSSKSQTALYGLLLAPGTRQRHVVVAPYMVQGGDAGVAQLQLALPQAG